MLLYTVRHAATYHQLSASRCGTDVITHLAEIEGSLLVGVVLDHQLVEPNLVETGRSETSPDDAEQQNPERHMEIQSCEPCTNWITWVKSNTRPNA